MIFKSENSNEVTKKNKTLSQREELIAQLDKEDESVLATDPKQEADSKENQKFKELYSQNSAKNTFTVGQVVKGRIINVDDDHVIVDINYKSEGLIPKSEFHGAKGFEDIEIGTEVEVCIDAIENDNGMMILSKNRADIVRAWQDISQVAKSQKVIQGVVIAKMKGGLHVDIGGVKAFLPGSQIELRPVKDLNQYLGQTYSFKIIRFNQKRGNIVLSRRVILEEERESLRSQVLDGIEKGSVISGIVKNITDYGAFLDLGGIDGLLHITDISWSRIQHPSEKMKVGDMLKVKVLKFDRDKKRVSLGLKQLHESENPWENIIKEIKEGDKVKGTVTSLTNYGAFVSIKEGIEGLVHISEITWDKQDKTPADLLKVGEEVNLQVIGMDYEHQHISFSIKRLLDNPWKEWIEKYPSNTQVEATVKSVTENGVAIEFGENLRGFIRNSDFSWSTRHSIKYNVGDKIKSVVLKFNEEENQFQLGIKQLTENPWERIESLYPIGSTHNVKVIKVVDFGVFVELGEANGVEGLIHVSELSTKRINKVEDAVKMGDMIEAEIITMDKEARKIGLSAKLVQLRKESGSKGESAASKHAADEKSKEGFFAKILRASIASNKSDSATKEENKEEDKNNSSQ